jgi:hypothetical protein
VLSSHRRAFVDAADIALDLASSAEVGAAWDAESSCAGMSVGGLAHHLVGQPVDTARLLDAEPGLEPISLLEHYDRAAWVTAGHDDDVNVTIRTGSDRFAAAGRDAVLDNARQALDRLPTLLEAPRDPDTVLIAWQGWAMATDDFLTTRLMEIVVHSDDLAASVDLPTPVFPDDAVTPALALLTSVAAHRHGQAAVVRLLTRPQRAPTDFSAF